MEWLDLYFIQRGVYRANGAFTLEIEGMALFEQLNEIGDAADTGYEALALATADVDAPHGDVDLFVSTLRKRCASPEMMVTGTSPDGTDLIWPW